MKNMETNFMPFSIFKSALFSISCLFVCCFFWLFFVVVVVVVFCFVSCHSFLRILVFCFVFYFCFLVQSYHCLINITRSTPWFVFHSHS